MKKIILIIIFISFFLFTSFNVENYKKNDLYLLYYKHKTEKLELDYNSLVKENIPLFVSYYTILTSNKKILEEIIIQSINNEVPINLSLAVAQKESNFKVYAINYNYDSNGNIKSIDRGIFQLNNLSFPELTEKDFFDYKKNIYYGIKYLKYCIDSFNSYSQAISAYNGGHYKVKYNENVFEETYNYVSDVIRLYAILDQKLFAFLEEIND